MYIYNIIIIIIIMVLKILKEIQKRSSINIYLKLFIFLNIMVYFLSLISKLLGLFTIFKLFEAQTQRFSEMKKYVDIDEKDFYNSETTELPLIDNWVDFNLIFTEIPTYRLVTKKLIIPMTGTKYDFYFSYFQVRNREKIIDATSLEAKGFFFEFNKKIELKESRPFVVYKEYDKVKIPYSIFMLNPLWILRQNVDILGKDEQISYFSEPKKLTNLLVRNEKVWYYLPAKDDWWLICMRYHKMNAPSFFYIELSKVDLKTFFNPIDYDDYGPYYRNFFLEEDFFETTYYIFFYYSKMYDYIIEDENEYEFFVENGEYSYHKDIADEYFYPIQLNPMSIYNLDVDLDVYYHRGEYAWEDISPIIRRIIL